MARALNSDPTLLDEGVQRELVDLMTESVGHIQGCMRRNPDCFFNLTPNNFPYSSDSAISLRQNNILAILDALKYDAEGELDKLRK